MADKKVEVKISLKDRATAPLKKFKTALTSIKGLLVAGIGLAALNKGLRATVGRAQSAETQLKKLAVAMQSAGRFTVENIKHFEQFAVTLEKQTGVIEEEVLQAMAVLQTFGQMSREDMDKTIVAALDMSTVFGETLQQSAVRLGKAYNGNIRGLQMMGVGIDAATIKAKGFQGVLDQLAKEQGGQARARMAGFEGAVNRVSVAFGEAGKQIGKFVTGNKTIKTVIDALGGGLNKIAEFIKKYRDGQIGADKATRDHTQSINDQIQSLEQLGKESLYLEILSQFHKIETRYNEFVVANQDVVFSYKQLVKAFEEEGKTAAEAQAFMLDIGSQREKTLIELMKEELDIRKKLNLAITDKNVIRAFETQAEKAKNLADIEEELAEKGLRAGRIYGALAENIRARIEAEQKAAEDRDKAETEALNAAFVNLKAHADIVKKFNEDELNVVRETIRKETELRKAQQETIFQIQSGALRKVLQEDKLNVTERKVLLEEQEDAADKLADAISRAGTGTELQPLLEQLKLMQTTFGDIDADRLKESLDDAAQAAADAIKKIGETPIQLEDLMDAANIKLSAGALGTDAGRAFWDSFQNEISARRIKLPSLQSSFFED